MDAVKETRTVAMAMETKVCKRCETTKPVSEFAPNFRKPQGYFDTCKGCRTAGVSATVAAKKESAARPMPRMPQMYEMKPGGELAAASAVSANGAGGKPRRGYAAMLSEAGENVPMPDRESCTHFRLAGEERIRDVFPEFYNAYDPAPSHSQWQVCILCGDVQMQQVYAKQGYSRVNGVPPVKYTRVYVPARVRSMAADALSAARYATAGHRSSSANGNVTSISGWRNHPVQPPELTSLPPEPVADEDATTGDVPADYAAWLPPVEHVGVGLPSGAVAAVDPSVLGTEEGDQLLKDLDQVAEAVVEQFREDNIPALLEEGEPISWEDAAHYEIAIPGDDFPTTPLLPADALALPDDQVIQDMHLRTIEQEELIAELRGRLATVECRAREVIEADQSSYKAQLLAKDAAIATLVERLGKAERIIAYAWGTSRAVEGSARQAADMLEEYGRA